MATDKEERLREGVATMRYMESQMAAIQQQLAGFERALAEVATTKIAIEAIEKMEKDSPSLLPLGSGVFAHGTLVRQDKLLTDVGAGVIVEKSVAETRKLLEAREQEISSGIKTFQQGAASIEKQYAELGEKLRELSEKA